MTTNDFSHLPRAERLTALRRVQQENDRKDPSVRKQELIEERKILGESFHLNDEEFLLSVTKRGSRFQVLARNNRPHPMLDNTRSKWFNAEEFDHYNGAFQRGRRLREVEMELKQVEAKIQAEEAKNSPKTDI
jgi:hypothetical protein